jgi:hypothetical protein
MRLAVLSEVAPLSGFDCRDDIHRSGRFHDAKRDRTALEETLPAMVRWNVPATV